MRSEQGRVLLYEGIFTGNGALPTLFFLHAQGIPYRVVTDQDLAEIAYTPEDRLFLFPAGHCFEPTPEWALGGAPGQERLREAIADGMSYLGICAGALAATPARVYPIAISLGLTKAMPRWGKQGPGAGTCFLTVRLGRGLARLAGLEGEHRQVWYHNGPILQRSRESRYRALATFEPTPDERTQMRGQFLFRKHLHGAPAISETRYGRGRVVLCAPHFEYGDESVRGYLARFQGWVGGQRIDMAEGDCLAPGRTGRRAFLDTLGGEWMAPVLKSTNWRVLAALINDLRGGTPPAPARSR
jgi:hypothetical protein